MILSAEIRNYSEGVITALIAQRPERRGYDGVKSLCNHFAVQAE